MIMMMTMTMTMMMMMMMMMIYEAVLSSQVLVHKNFTCEFPISHLTLQSMSRS